MGGSFTTDGVLHEFAMAVGAQVVALTLVDVFTHVIGIFVIEPFQDLVKFQQMIAIIVQLVTIDRVDLCLNFEPNHIAELITA